MCAGDGQSGGSNRLLKRQGGVRCKDVEGERLLCCGEISWMPQLCPLQTFSLLLVVWLVAKYSSRSN